MSKRNIFAAYLSLSSPLSDERRSLRRYLGPRRSESFITVVEGTDLVYFTLVCILTFFPPVAIFFSLRILRSHAQSICSNCFRAKIYVTRNYGTLLSFHLNLKTPQVSIAPDSAADIITHLQLSSTLPKIHELFRSPPSTTDVKVTFLDPLANVDQGRRLENNLWYILSFLRSLSCC